MLKLSTPVAFLVFNRPQTTSRVWEAIRRAQPSKLLIVADGPRGDRAGEAERCAAVRAICEQVDWRCEVLRNYADANLGCRRRVSSGLDWVFDMVEEAIIVEDDCLPHPTFFPFCEELLARYRNDERVMLIRGSHFSPIPPRSDYSYYFSQYPHIWGWATWRRVWRHYDVHMKLWPVVRNGRPFGDLFRTRQLAAYWRDIFDRVASNRIDTWDYQLFFACFCQSGLSIAPSVNLVSNIGFGDDATHTLGTSRIANLAVGNLPSPLLHPPHMMRDAEMDSMTAKILFRKPSTVDYLMSGAKALCRSLVGERRYRSLKRLLRGRIDDAPHQKQDACQDAVGQAQRS